MGQFSAALSGMDLSSFIPPVDAEAGQSSVDIAQEAAIRNIHRSSEAIQDQVARRPIRPRQCSNLMGKGSTRRLFIGPIMTMSRAGCKRDRRAAPLATAPPRGYSDGDDGTLRGSPAQMLIFLVLTTPRIAPGGGVMLINK
jgi:hypothetical protein